MNRERLGLALLFLMVVRLSGQTVEDVSCDAISGYAALQTAYVFVDGTFWAATPVNLPRPDLYTDPNYVEHGFRYAIPAELKDGQRHQFVVKDTSDGYAWGSAYYLTCGGPAHYDYFASDGFPTVNPAKWTVNGSPAGSVWGLTASTAAGGSVIWNSEVPGGSVGYEVKATLRLTTSGGTYAIFLRASPDASSGTAASGTYYSVELQNPTYSGTACGANLALYKRVSGVITLLTSTSVPCRDGTVLRTVEINGLVWIFVDDVYYTGIVDTSITSGQPGVGAYSTPAGNSVARVALGALDRVPSSPVEPQSIIVSRNPNEVSIQWQAATDDASGVGIFHYYVDRDGVFLGDYTTPNLVDVTVQPATTYQYRIFPIDYHHNEAPPALVTVTTPDQSSLDPRRVGVRADGTYWGASGEQIDTRSGNLNFAIPLVTAVGRGGLKMPFGLSVDTQLWRQDGGGIWKLGRDVGYGFGWRLQLGSITPQWGLAGC